MFAIQIHTVLEEKVEQQFQKCGNFGATMQLRRADILALIFVRLATKGVIIYCNETEKKIHKKQWNEATRLQAKNLLKQHKTPKLGFYLLGLISIALVVSFWWVELGSKTSYYNTFLEKTVEQTEQILSQLDKNDLIKATDGVYRISGINNDTIILEKSAVKVLSFETPINPNNYPDDTFLFTVKIKRDLFAFGLLTTINGDPISTILDYHDN